MKSRLDKNLECYPDDVQVFALKADGFDNACVGICVNTNRLIYSYDLCIDVLTSEHGMSLSDADDYLHFNVIGSFVGEKTPIWIDLF